MPFKSKEDYNRYKREYYKWTRMLEQGEKDLFAMVNKAFSLNLEFSGDSVKDFQRLIENNDYFYALGVAAFLVLDARKKTEEVNSLNEVAEVFKEATRKLEGFIVKLKEM